MKKKIICALLLCTICLSACSKKDNKKIEETNFDNIINPTVAKEEIVKENEVPTTTEAASEEAPVVNQYVTLENPGWDYYINKEYSIQQDKPTSITLKQVSSKANKITDTDEWFIKNELSKDCFRDGCTWKDDEYIYKVEQNYKAHVLEIYNGKTQEFIKQYDFTNFIYTPEYKKEDYDYIDQSIFYATIEEDILYVGYGHNTYAKSSPQNAYVIAINTRNDKVVWKSSPLVNNASAFEVIGDNLICGYGFTAEPDYLYILDRYTGLKKETIKLKTAPEYIVQKGNQLFVRTYNTDYVFDIIQ